MLTGVSRIVVQRAWTLLQGRRCRCRHITSLRRHWFFLLCPTSCVLRCIPSGRSLTASQTLFRQTTRFYSLTYIIGHRCTRIRRDRMRSHAPQSPHIKIEGRPTRGTAGFPPKSALPSSGLRNSTTDNLNTRTSSDVRA